ncbi:hypothetical protein [Phaeovulum sp.]|uniref:hypothetical protein n=1 Tax=Phaeovulum sp. TaxID=2934796 RepID=UPI003569F631
MKRAEKLAALERVALLRRDAALQLYKLARTAEASARADLAALDTAERAATAASSGDVAAARQLAIYHCWAAAHRKTGEANLTRAIGHSETCRAEAQRALGRTEVLVRLAKRLAAQNSALKARRN